MIDAICKELQLRQSFFSQPISTIYFGGGTPSLLTVIELQQLFTTIYSLYSVGKDAEITMECNPDDLTRDYCEQLRKLGVNRLSIGIQSFFDEDLTQLNRRHTAEQARKAMKIAQVAGFQNITVDLIYGLPNMTLEKWKHNLEEVEQLQVQHLSAYSLMVEEHTAMHKFVREGTFRLPSEESVLEQWHYLVEWSQNNGFEQYEISNFAKYGFQSRHNSSYWKGDSYLGVGPSAHSFNGENRYWNVANNRKYLESMQKDVIPCEVEHLTEKDFFNELILTRLRMREGLCLNELQKFPLSWQQHFQTKMGNFVSQKLLTREDNNIHLTQDGIMVSDMVMRELFES